MSNCITNAFKFCRNIPEKATVPIYEKVFVNVINDIEVMKNSNRQRKFQVWFSQLDRKEGSYGRNSPKGLVFISKSFKL